MARLLKTLDAGRQGGQREGRVVAVWLTNSRRDQGLPAQGQMSLNFVNTSLGVFEGDKSGPNNWGINPTPTARSSSLKGGKVVESIALQSANETDAAKVVEALKKAK